MLVGAFVQEEGDCVLEGDDAFGEVAEERDDDVGVVIFEEWTGCRLGHGGRLRVGKPETGGGGGPE